MEIFVLSSFRLFVSSSASKDFVFSYVSSSDEAVFVSSHTRRFAPSFGKSIFVYSFHECAFACFVYTYKPPVTWSSVGLYSFSFVDSSIRLTNRYSLICPIRSPRYVYRAAAPHELTKKFGLLACLLLSVDERRRRCTS